MRRKIYLIAYYSVLSVLLPIIFRPLSSQLDGNNSGHYKTCEGHPPLLWLLPTGGKRGLGCIEGAPFLFLHSESANRWLF
jgi:hypothetical protein